jgi:hypothetical protein
MRPRALLLGGLLSTVLAMSVSGIALAGPDAQIFIHDDTDTEPVVGGTITVCEFHLQVEPGSDAHETGTWRIDDTAGSTVLSGEYETIGNEGDRIPDTGSFSLAEGSYTLFWDSEPIDRSHQEKDFVVDCGGVAPTASPTTSPTASPTASPNTGGPGGTAAPTGAALPTTGANVGGGGSTITLPPTDASVGPAPAPAESGSAWSIAIVLGAVALIAFLATPRTTARRPVRVDRERGERGS